MVFNEEDRILQYLDWYSPIVDSIVIMDNYSTDKTVEIAKKSGCKVISNVGIDGKHDELIELEIKENCWKNSGADWVFIVDIDEFLYHPNLRTLLQNTEATIIRPHGYLMISEDYIPFKEVKMGIDEEDGGKITCFRPDSITGMNWEPGCHSCNPEGFVHFLTDPAIKLLHFFYVGRKEFKEKRTLRSKRSSENDIRWDFGIHYRKSEKEMDEEFDFQFKRAVKVW